MNRKSVHHALKNIAKVMLTIIASVSFILMCGETADGSVNFLWTFGWMAAFAISLKTLEKILTKDETI